MAKYKERLKARELRRKGESIGGIAKKLGVSKGSVSLWCRDIVLSEKQVKKLLGREIVGGIKGRMKAWEWHRNERMERERKFHNRGLERVRMISDRDLFVIGLALYWAEGDKKTRRVGLINSDLKMILMFIRWLNECFGIKRDRLTCVVGINEIHKDRIDDVEKYWSKMTKIPLSQFRKPSFKKVKNKKVYKNHDTHYGSLVVKVTRSTNLCYEILGGIAGLKGGVEVKSNMLEAG